MKIFNYKKDIIIKNKLQFYIFDYETLIEKGLC